MKNRCDARIKLVVAACLAMCLSFYRVSGAVVFEAGFDGPLGGTGATAYNMVTTGGSGALIIDSAGRLVTQVSHTDSMAGGGGYLNCCVNTNRPTVTLSIANLTPSLAENSLDAMTSVVNSDRVINGGLDFFFRSDKRILSSEMRALDSDD